MRQESISNWLAVVATVLAAVASAAGLLVTGLYRDSANWVQQARGTDLATLFLAVPVLGFGLSADRRESSLGRLAVVAGLLYVVYNYAIFAFSVAMNPLTAVHLAILGTALWSLILGARSATLVEAGKAITGRIRRRASGWLLIGVAGLFGLLWMGQIAATTATGTLPPDLARAGLATNPVYALDLAFFLPLCAVAGIGLLRRGSAGVFALPMLIWVPLMGAGVLGGFVFAALAGEPVPIVVVAVIGILSLASGILAAGAMVRRAPFATTRLAGPARRSARMGG